MPSGDTVALCKGGAFNITNGGYLMTRTGCTPGTTCVDLREYSPTTFAGTAKPIINNLSGGSTLFSFNGDYGGVRFLNLRLQGDNGAYGNNNWAFYFNNGAHDITIGNLDIYDFDLFAYNQNGTTLDTPNGDLKVTGNTISNIRQIAWLGTGQRLELSYNHWYHSGGSSGGDHTIYLSSHFEQYGVNVIGNYIEGHYGATCGDGLFMGHGMIDGFIVKDNVVDPKDPTPNCYGITFNNSDAYTSGHNFRNTVISGNTVVNYGARGITLSSCPDCIIENNVLISNISGGFRQIGIWMPTSASADAQDDINERNVIRNNTIWFGSSSNGGAVGIRIGTEGMGHIISNNTVYYGSTTAGNGVSCFDYSLALTAYAFINNNHCYSAATYAWVEGRGDISAWRTYSAAQGFDTASITGNPLFTNAPTDFTPLVGSPLIGAGDALHESAFDITGKARPGLPSIGAYEP
jgi:parallel beta-helix repeat protein